MSTSNWLDLQTRGSQLVIMPKIILDQWDERPHILVAVNGVRPFTAGHNQYVWGGL